MGNALAGVLRLLEQSHYENALGCGETARKLCLSAISSLNQILKTGHNDVETLKMVSQDAIEYYQKLKGKEKTEIGDRLLWLSSALNGHFFPLVMYKKCVLVDSTEDLVDPLTLSQSQKAQLDKWVEIDQQDWSFDGVDDVYQDFLQDCSFVVAFVSLSRDNRQMLMDRITPHRNSSKRFGVNLKFSGCERLVEVGNSLPFLKTKSLFTRSRTNDQLYWPALLEKAYLKVLGNGYDSKGSNAGIDTYLLSGWIPEFISSAIERPDFNLLWEELFQGFKMNNLVLAIGTGIHTSEGYHPNHDYAIIDLVEKTKSAVVKNPWDGKTTLIEFHEIFEIFQTLYINWNMNGYFHLSKNFIWNLRSLDSQFGSYLNYPQFSLKNESSEELEFNILLEKHLGFAESNINLGIFETKMGERVVTNSGPLVRPSGNNTGFLLVKFKVPPLGAATIVILNDSTSLQNFTLHAYSESSQFKLEKSELYPPFSKEFNDKWDVDSCGGNWYHQSYIKNPQYEIVAPEHHENISTSVYLFTKKEVMINIQMFWESDKNKPFDQSKASLINEKYKNGQFIHHLNLKPGQRYKLVVSTYDPDVVESFKLLISSSVDLAIDRVPTRLGLFSKKFRFNWNNKNRFKLKFGCSRLTSISVHLATNQALFSHYRPKIRASLFYEGGEVISMNPEFDDNLYGIWIQDVSLKPDTPVILLIERFEVGNDDIFGEIGSDFKIDML